MCSCLETKHHRPVHLMSCKYNNMQRFMVNLANLPSLTSELQESSKLPIPSAFFTFPPACKPAHTTIDPILVMADHCVI